MGALIRLQWTQYPDGLKVVEDWERLDPQRVGEQAPLRLEPVRPERRKPYVLEGTSEKVFLELAKVHTVDDVVGFTHRRGFLGNVDFSAYVHPQGPGVVTAVEYVLSTADLIREAIDHARSGRGVALEALLVKLHARPQLRPRWAKLAGDSAPRFFIEPHNLEDFCVYELCQTVERIEIRSCLRCGDPIATGNVGMPPRYCSDACRVAMHRRKKREAELRASNMASLRRSAGR